MQELDLSFMNNGVLYDRDLEKNTLIKSFKRIISAESLNEFILISGKSGTGKTSLAQKLREHVVTSTEGFFIAGKFDQLQKSQPYSGT